MQFIRKDLVRNPKLLSLSASILCFAVIALLLIRKHPSNSLFIMVDMPKLTEEEVKEALETLHMREKESLNAEEKALLKELWRLFTTTTVQVGSNEPKHLDFKLQALDAIAYYRAVTPEDEYRGTMKLRLGLSPYSWDARDIKWLKYLFANIKLNKAILSLGYILYGTNNTRIPLYTFLPSFIIKATSISIITIEVCDNEVNALQGGHLIKELIQSRQIVCGQVTGLSKNDITIKLDPQYTAASIFFLQVDSKVTVQINALEMPLDQYLERNRTTFLTKLHNVTQLMNDKPHALWALRNPLLRFLTVDIHKILESCRLEEACSSWANEKTPGLWGTQVSILRSILCSVPSTLDKEDSVSIHSLPIEIWVYIFQYVSISDIKIQQQKNVELS